MLRRRKGEQEDGFCHGIGRGTGGHVEGFCGRGLCAMPATACLLLTMCALTVCRDFLPRGVIRDQADLDYIQQHLAALGRA